MIDQLPEIKVVSRQAHLTTVYVIKITNLAVRLRQRLAPKLRSFNT